MIKEEEKLRKENKELKDKIKLLEAENKYLFQAYCIQRDIRYKEKGVIVCR